MGLGRRRRRTRRVSPARPVSEATGPAATLRSPPRDARVTRDSKIRRDPVRAPDPTRSASAPRSRNSRGGRLPGTAARPAPSRPTRRRSGPGERPESVGGGRWGVPERSKRRRGSAGFSVSGTPVLRGSFAGPRQGHPQKRRRAHSRPPYTFRPFYPFTFFVSLFF